MMDSSESPQKSEIDVLVVGAGPIGLETAYELRQAGLSTLNIDRAALGNQIMEFPPGVRFFSSPERIAIAGVPLQTVDQEKASREEYLAYLRTVVLMHELPIRTFEEVRSIEGGVGGFITHTRTSSGIERTIRSRHIVLAVGGTTRPRTLGIPGEELPHVLREVGDVHRFFKRRVLVVGGRNSAADSALRIWRAKGDVTMSYRGEELYPRIKYWIRPELEVLIRNEFIHCHYATRPVEILPDRVTLEHIHDGSRFDVPVDDVLLQIGYEADMSLFKAVGCELDGDAQRVSHDPDTMETSIPGIHVAGTSIAGTQARYEVYIENAHVHARRIAAHLSGQPAPPTPRLPELPEA
jgi:thioredoxin reductase (NADPH)